MNPACDCAVHSRNSQPFSRYRVPQQRYMTYFQPITHTTSLQLDPRETACSTLLAKLSTPAPPCPQRPCLSAALKCAGQAARARPQQLVHHLDAAPRCTQQRTAGGLVSRPRCPKHGQHGEDRDGCGPLSVCSGSRRLHSARGRRCRSSSSRPWNPGAGPARPVSNLVGSANICEYLRDCGINFSSADE